MSCKLGSFDYQASDIVLKGQRDVGWKSVTCSLNKTAQWFNSNRSEDSSNGPFSQQTFRLVIVLQTTLVIALFCASVLVSCDSVTVSVCVQHQDPEIDAVKWNLAAIHLNTYSSVINTVRTVYEYSGQFYHFPLMQPG